MASLVADAAGVAELAEALQHADAIAVDVESNGLFVYRPKLCTVQLAWRAGDEHRIAVVDSLRASVAPLASALGESGPRKVLHDLTFDARLLAEHGVTLGRVFDTSVMGRLLGRKALGLAALVEAALGVVVSKGLQQHDWTERPITTAQLAYLEDDVRHLLALETALSGDVERAGIAWEVAEETRYKLDEALAPPRVLPPAYLRIKGLEKLDPIGQAIVRRVVMVREEIAAAEDVPPFKVTGNDALLELATKRPTSPAAASALARGRASRYGSRWVEAVKQGLEDGALPPEDASVLRPPRPPRDVIARERARQERLRGWRKAEAERRSVDEQAVLPGHCLNDLVSVGPGNEAELRAIAGLGELRVTRDGAMLLQLVAGPPAAPVESD